MTTRAEEIAAEEIRWDLSVRESLGLSNEAIYGTRDIARAAFVKGYKHGQQDRWIPLSERYPERGSRFVLWNARKKQASPGIFTHDMDEVNWTEKYGFTHWCDYPSPPNPEQP